MSAPFPGEDFRRHALAISMAAVCDVTSAHPLTILLGDRLFWRCDPIDCKRICSKFGANYTGARLCDSKPEVCRCFVQNRKIAQVRTYIRGETLQPVIFPFDNRFRLFGKRTISPLFCCKTNNKVYRNFKQNNSIQHKNLYR